MLNIYLNCDIINKKRGVVMNRNKLLSMLIAFSIICIHFTLLSFVNEFIFFKVLAVVFFIAVLISAIAFLVFYFSGSSKEFESEYKSQTEDMKLSLKKTGECIYTVNGIEYYGVYFKSSPNGWTVKIDSFGELFSFQYDRENLIVKSDVYENVFERISL